MEKTTSQKLIEATTVLFRGNKSESIIGSSEYTEVVSIEFDFIETAKEWFQSEQYQSIISIRKEAADVTLELYE